METDKPKLIDILFILILLFANGFTIYTLEHLKRPFYEHLIEQGLTVSGRVHCGFDISSNMSDVFLHK